MDRVSKDNSLCSPVKYKGDGTRLVAREKLLANVQLTRISTSQGHNGKFYKTYQLRPYLPESTGSRLISEVKPVRALLVLWFGDNMGTPGCRSFFFYRFANFNHSNVHLFLLNRGIQGKIFFI